MANPGRNLPKILNTAMVIAVTSFALVNIALFTSMPFSSVRHETAVIVVSCPNGYAEKC